MVNIFLDIETVPEFANMQEYFEVKKGIEAGTITSGDLFWKYRVGALNPYEAKVVLITYQIDNQPTKYLKEWEASESHILQEFFSILDSCRKEKPALLGFNIANFDLPFLFVRMSQNEILTSYKEAHDPKWLYKMLYGFAYMKDLQQMHLPLNDFDRLGLEHNAIAEAYGFPTKDYKGNLIPDFYYNEVYENIMKYVEKEFIYPQVFAKIAMDGLVSKNKLQTIVKKILAKRTSVAEILPQQNKLTGVDVNG